MAGRNAGMDAGDARQALGDPIHSGDRQPLSALVPLMGGVSYLLGGLELMAGLLKRKQAGINKAGLKAYRSQP